MSVSEDEKLMPLKCEKALRFDSKQGRLGQQKATSDKKLIEAVDFQNARVPDITVGTWGGEGDVVVVG